MANSATPDLEMGTTHTYSSLLTEEQATNELLVSVEGAPILTVKHQNFTSDARKKNWNKNSVSLELAKGFIESLESTSINLVHRALTILMDFCPDEDIDKNSQHEANVAFDK
ncbi:hypothetical protein NBRC116583_34560 [Arenicella sp. 4NH20-0111]|uniref:tryptophan 7-halogenase n=1 Tax=Arenicella sp. 4NH20-0111 TaxID=3127648 RepID=UPI00310C15AA